MKKKVKSVIVSGGTGFIGRAVVEKFLKEKFKVILISRSKTKEEVIERILSHGINKNLLSNSINKNSLIFLLNIDLCLNKFQKTIIWKEIFSNNNIDPLEIECVINLVASSLGEKKQIISSSLHTIHSILSLVRNLKKKKNCVFINMGSVSELKDIKTGNLYQATKKEAYKILISSNLCNYHILPHYVKGRGEKKIKNYAKTFWNLNKISNNWVNKPVVSIIDVDILAEKIFYLVNKQIIYCKMKSVYITNGEITFAQMIKYSLPLSERRNFKSIFKKGLFEKYFLQTYSNIINLFFKNNQILKRKANLARQTYNIVYRGKSNVYFPTSRVIKQKVKLKMLNNKKSDIEYEDCNSIYFLCYKNKKEIFNIIEKCLS